MGTAFLVKQSPKETLASDSPKCGNCKWMRQLCHHGAVYGSPIPGKGACMEPAVAAAYPQLLHVTDLMLCSAWEVKESM